MPQQPSRMRPTLTAAYICDRLNLGLPWREHVNAIIKRSANESSKRIDEEISAMILNSHGPRASEIFTTLIAGINIGLAIAEDRAITPFPKPADFDTRRATQDS